MHEFTPLLFEKRDGQSLLSQLHFLTTRIKASSKGENMHVFTSLLWFLLYKQRTMHAFTPLLFEMRDWQSLQLFDYMYIPKLFPKEKTCMHLHLEECGSKSRRAVLSAGIGYPLHIWSVTVNETFCELHWRCMCYTTDSQTSICNTELCKYI